MPNCKLTAALSLKWPANVTSKIRVVKTAIPFQAAVSGPLVTHLTRLSSIAPIFTVNDLQRDIAICVGNGRKKMKLALANHCGGFAFTVEPRGAWEGEEFYMGMYIHSPRPAGPSLTVSAAIVIHWLTPGFKLVSALLDFPTVPHCAAAPIDRGDPLNEGQPYYHAFRTSLESFGIWPRISHITILQTGQFEANEAFVGLVARNVPGFSVQRSSSGCMLSRVNDAMKGYEEIAPVPFSLLPRHTPMEVFKDSLIVKFKDHGTRLFVADDEVTAMWAFPIVDQLLRQVREFQEKDTAGGASEGALERSAKLLEELHRQLRAAPAYYGSLFLNPRVKGKHFQEYWESPWIQEQEAELRKLWETRYQTSEIPRDLPQLLAETALQFPGYEGYEGDGDGEGGDESPTDEEIAAVAFKRGFYVSLGDEYVSAAEIANIATADELERYRALPRIPLNEWEDRYKSSPHNWWAEVGRHQFPHLACMARELLAVQRWSYLPPFP